MVQFYSNNATNLHSLNFRQYMPCCPRT